MIGVETDLDVIFDVADAEACEGLGDWDCSEPATWRAFMRCCPTRAVLYCTRHKEVLFLLLATRPGPALCGVHGEMDVPSLADAMDARSL
jgi:hypothetical protein